MDTKSSIKEYFTGKNIFITGGTGFLGKALIEKLLRSCPDLNKIYLLIRPKKGKLLHERVEDIISSPVFTVLKKTLPENLNKIVPIAGDIKELKLGLSTQDKQLLINKTHVFFHTAASVRFTDFLNTAVLLNLRSTREAAILALEMKQLEVFMHVSTAYCNIDNKQTVDEVLYPPQGHWKATISIAENCDENILNVLSQKYIGVFPNTYTYTKQLAEHCIHDLLVGKVPTVIYRPSIVAGSLVDPYQGWIDNFNGPSGLVAGYLSGLVKIVYANPDVIGDYVPVDFVIKSMIVSVWHKKNYSNNTKLDIYHGSTNCLMPLDILVISRKSLWSMYLRKTIWFPRLSITRCPYYYFINFIIFQLIPAIILDLAIKVSGNRPVLFKTQKKLYITMSALSPFLLNQWNFINTKTLSLADLIPKKEMHEFNFKILPSSEKNTLEFIAACCFHLKQHLLKEGRNLTELDYIRHLKMYWLDRACHLIFYGLLIWFAFIKINILLVIWNTIYNYFDNLP